MASLSYLYKRNISLQFYSRNYFNMKKPLYWISLSFVLIYSFCVFGHMTEILVEDDLTDVSRSNSVDPAPPDDPSNSICHVEFQVIKRAVGRCMKLGRNSRGCVAGTYLHPFHPECM